MDFQAFFQQYGLWVGLLALFIVLFIVATIIRNKSNKKLADMYREENPDAAKVYLASKANVTSEAVTIHNVNGEAAAYFVEGNKTGFYLEPGESEVVLSYTYTRPGVMYKSVTKSTEAVTRRLEVEPRKSYKLGFDRKAEDFTFEEMSEEQ